MGKAFGNFLMGLGLLVLLLAGLLSLSIHGDMILKVWADFWLNLSSDEVNSIIAMVGAFLLIVGMCVYVVADGGD